MTDSPTIRDIMAATCCVFRVTIADLKSQRRCQHCVRIKHMAVGLARELTDASYPVIAREFWFADHTGAINAVTADAAREDSVWRADRRMIIDAIPAAVAARHAEHGAIRKSLDEHGVRAGTGVLA